MRILVALNHPAHYYVFKYTVIKLEKQGFEVLYVIKNKDVLEKLLISEKVEYVKINEKRRRNQNFYSVISNGLVELVIQDRNLFRLVRRWKPKLMIGTDVSIAHIGFVLNIPSFIFNEDDFEINKLFCNSTYPFATKIIAPEVCSVGRYYKKKVGYNGFQKMAYLHPSYFQPDRTLIKEFVGEEELYSVIRLVSLTSGHDIEGKHRGLNQTILDRLIYSLSPKGKIFISSENPLEKRYEPYRLKIGPNYIHHLLAFASIFIGDSQTMCAEAGLLGTPFIRYNDFVGKIGYLNEIENTYNLGFGIETKNPEMIFDKIKELLSDPNTKSVWQRKREIIFDEKIDVAHWYSQFIISQF